MSKVFKWSNQSKLTIHFSKTKIMHFGSKAKKITDSCYVEGFTIENVHTYKYLGFLLDQELTFKADLKHTMRTISQKLYMFRKFKYFLNKKAKLDVVKAMLLSYFTYSNIFYGVCNNEERVIFKSYKIVLSGLLWKYTILETSQLRIFTL